MKMTRSVTLSTLAVIAFSHAFSARADNVFVDQSGQNTGNLTNGALLFGGQEPVDPVDCLVAHPIVGHGAVQPAAPCPNGPTTEGIISARIMGPFIAGQPLKPPPNQYGLDLFTDHQARISITHGGLIGIGTQAPTYNVHVQHAGDVQIALESTDAGHKLWTLQSSGMVDPARAGTFQIIDRDQNVQRLGIDSQGMVSVKSLQITGGADLAEPFNTGGHLPVGSLVIIDDTEPGQLIPSTRAYDRRVAGVVSGANNIRPGVSLEQLGSGERRQQVALSGRVFALADASNGPIRPGDLLTTSGEPLHAMRATDLHKAQGAIIGKAMSRLDSGSGLVLVLVSLQ